MRLEVGEDLREHGHTGLKRGAGEEEPAEAHHMEGEDNGEALAHTPRAVMLVVPQQGAPRLVQAQRHAVHAAPHHEVPRCAVPQSAQQHGEKLVQIHAPAAATVAAQ